MKGPASSWSAKLYKEMKKAGIRLCVSLPDSWLSDLIVRMEADPEMIHVPVSQEEEGVGVCCGAVAGGMRAALVVQNVGVMNSLGALATFPISYGIPFLLIISDRGRLGDQAFYDVEKGKNARALLAQIGIQHFDIPADFYAQGTVSDAHGLAEAAQKPIALLITRETFGA